MAKTASLLYQSIKKSLSVQVYAKPVDCTIIYKTSLLVNDERNVHGQNIKECTWTDHYQG